MKPIDIRFYPLPNGEFVVSYYDSLRRTRIQKTFQEEWKATENFNVLRMWKPIKERKRTLKDVSIEELLQVYLEEVPDASLGKSPQLVKDFLDQFAFHKLEKIDEIAMRSFYHKQKLEYDYTSWSLATRKYQIQGFFKWAVSRGLIEESPQSKISMGRSQVYRRKHIWVKPKEISNAISAAKVRSPGFLYPILLFAIETAAKTNEIINFKWRDLDVKNKTVRLHEAEKIQRRDVTISQTLFDAIKQIDQISEFVFTNLEGRPLRKEILTRELRIFKRQCEIEEVWVYRDLRFSVAVNFLKAGGTISDLQLLMGHHHPRITEELYGRYKTQKVDIFDIEVVPGTVSSESKISKFEEF